MGPLKHTGTGPAKPLKNGPFLGSVPKIFDAQLKAIPQQFRLEATVNASYNLHFDAPAA